MTITTGTDWFNAGEAVRFVNTWIVEAGGSWMVGRVTLLITPAKPETDSRIPTIAIMKRRGACIAGLPCHVWRQEARTGKI